MRILAMIINRPMAFLFSLLFVIACGYVVYSVSTTPLENDTLSGVYEVDNPDVLNKDQTGDILSDVVTKNPVGVSDSGEEVAAIVVVSDPVNGPEECTSLERFDPVQEYCFFTCETDAQCDQIEDQIEKELDGIGDLYDDFNDSINEDDHEIDQSKVLARYSVDEGEFLTQEVGEENQMYVDLWEKFATISPDDISDKYIARFSIYRDGESDTAAFVEQISGVGPKWGVYINIDAIEQDTDTENMFLLVHEFAHILTLNAGQVDPQVDESVCTGFFTGEGCALVDSYIGMFFDKFWTQGDLVSALEVQGGDVNPVYEKNPEKFISDYAATNPGEDIAESFASFIFKKKVVENPTVAQQKYDFFYEFPYLVKLRTEVRRTLGVQRAFQRR